MTEATAYLQANQDRLEAFTKAITQAHGAHHPEVFDVREAYLQLRDKINAGATDIEEDFTQLRNLTDDYAIPGDVCQTFEATYRMLEKADYINAQ